MSAKPDTPITRKEMYLDVMTGGSATLPEPVTIEEKYLAKIAGMAVNLPAPVPLKHKFLAKIAGMQIDVPTYTTDLPRIYAYLAKAAGQDVEIPQPVTREEMYWFDYCGGTPTPPEREYTGAVPVTFVADGTPLLDYIISGNTAQSGTPTPDNPIMPQGTGERTGNLFDKSTWNGANAIRGTVEEVANGFKITAVSGDAYTETYGSAHPNCSYQVTAGETYTLSWDINDDSILGYVYLFYGTGAAGSILSYTKAENKRITFTIPSGHNYVAFRIGVTNSGNSLIYTNIMLNTGSTPLPYEPWGIKIPISSANTTTPVYLGEVQTTRKIKKLVLTGAEKYIQYAGETGVGMRLTVDDMRIPSSVAQRVDGYCTHFVPTTAPSEAIGDNITFGTNSNIIYMILSVASQQALNVSNFDEFKAWISAQYAAGTPVTVWYVLANETTGIVNEPLMKIGDYADTLSMEQAGVSVPTVAGSNTLDVLTSTKPSEVYIKYKGEPVSQLSMLSSNSTDEPEEAPEELSEEVEEIPEEEVPEEFPEEKEEETESITPETEE